MDGVGDCEVRRDGGVGDASCKEGSPWVFNRRRLFDGGVEYSRVSEAVICKEEQSQTSLVVHGP
jgi:hypothetical protein